MIIFAEVICSSCSYIEVCVENMVSPEKERVKQAYSSALGLHYLPELFFYCGSAHLTRLWNSRGGYPADSWTTELRDRIRV